MKSVTLGDMIIACPRCDGHKGDTNEVVTPDKLSFDDIGIHIKASGSVVYCKHNTRAAFARILALWPEPKMKHRLYNGKEWTYCENTEIFQISPLNSGPYDDDWRVEIGIGSVIGGAGFGYERDFVLVRMPHHGNVVIKAGVRIGANVCIDRAVIGSTVIGEGTKIDNLVHVAHGVKIGKNCLVVAGTIIGGSVEIGDNCFIGMGAKIKNKVTIGNGVTIGAGAVVLKNVPDGETWAGVPAKKL